MTTLNCISFQPHGCKAVPDKLTYLLTFILLTPGGDLRRLAANQQRTVDVVYDGRRPAACLLVTDVVQPPPQTASDMPSLALHMTQYQSLLTAASSNSYTLYTATHSRSPVSAPPPDDARFCRFDGHGIKYVCGHQLTVFGYLVIRCISGCSTCLSG